MKSLDRRRYPRHDSWFPVQIDCAGGPSNLMGCCVDGSASGLLVRSPAMFEPGERVTLVFKVVSTQPDWIRARAEVIRSHDDGSDDPWPVWIAFRLAEPILKLELLYQIADARRAKGLGGRARLRTRTRKAAAGA